MKTLAKPLFNIKSHTEKVKIFLVVIFNVLLAILERLIKVPIYIYVIKDIEYRQFNITITF